MPRTNPEIGMREDEYLSRAFGDYFEATGRTDFPPGMALAMALGSYWLPRATMPKTKSRFKMLGGKVYAWWHGRKAKKGKAKKGADNGPQFDPRNDGKRENNTSNATS